MSTKKVNESYKAAAIGRKLQAMAEVEPNDTIANAMARLADHLEDFGQAFSAKSMQDLEKKTGMSQQIIKALINRAMKKESMAESKLVEGLGELADMAERDHEVQMARADLYKIAKYAIKLHDMLKQVTEAEGLEGWQQSKITKASDYISSVYHSLDYEMKFGEAEVAEGKSPHKKGTKKYKAHMAAMHAESAKDEYKSHLRAKLAEKQAVIDSKKKITEKSKSKAQQRFMGMVHAMQKGEKIKGASPELKKAAKTMPKKAAKDYAKTKHKGKPEHVKELDLAAPKQTYVRTGDGSYKLAKYRSTGGLHGSGAQDAAMAIKVVDVDPRVAKKLDLDKRLDFKSTKADGTKYKLDPMIAQGHDHQGGTPFSNPDIMAYDINSTEYKSQVPAKVQNAIIKSMTK